MTGNVPGMSGPRVSSGKDSKQDYRTPADFMAAVAKCFGPVVFDLAAHAANAWHQRYYAPEFLEVQVDPTTVLMGKFSDLAISSIARLVSMGADSEEARAAVDGAINANVRGRARVPNHDLKAFAKDALKQDWAWLSKQDPIGWLWLNCEFSDCETWAAKCASEAERGARILLLTPASVGSNWFANNIARTADVHLLNGRLCFDGVNPFPKDCMLSVFDKVNFKGRPRMYLWNWRANDCIQEWGA